MAMSHSVPKLRRPDATDPPTPIMPTLLALQPSSPLWKTSPLQWWLLGGAALALVASYLPALRFMVATWQQVEEYSYGWFVPAISAFLIWQRSDTLRRHELTGSWLGLGVVMVALLLGAVGQLSAIRSFSQYGFVLGVFGLSLAAIGVRGTRLIAMPLALLVFMIPLPQFVLREVSHSLQLVSSELGVAMIRLLGISVFLEGNVIDLGSYKLAVVEACSGLRYLFPLMVLGCLAAYFFQGAWWKRLFIVASTVPLTIAINSLRIAIIGVTVEHWGSEMAEGLLHDLEGGFMFLVCLALLIGEMALLARLGPRKQSLRSVFGLDLPVPMAKGAAPSTRRVSGPATAAGLLLVLTATITLAFPAGQQVAPARQSFNSFPLQLPGGWVGRADRIAPDILAVLAVDDYIIANYTRDKAPWVNFYSAYYASQSGGQSSHSPRTCIPGDGWSILKIDEVDVPLGRKDSGSESGNGSLRVNRALIQKGEHKHLVYYWFRQRGQTMTSEFQVKWRILRDGVLHDRSDGALIRLVTPFLATEDAATAEQRLIDFVRTAEPRLSAFIPD